jgi:hypothetical protein
MEKTSGGKTPGVDGAHFRKLIKIPSQSTKSDEAILELIKTLHPAYKLKSLTKGSNSLAIQRRGKAISPIEKLRRALQATTTGKIISKLAKLEYRRMQKDPQKYIILHNELVTTLNIALKYQLLDGLKHSALMKYKSKEILRVMIPKKDKKMRPLGIPTIYDRLIQKFMLLVMEPYMEPTGDQSS